jgi:hypothetical protein
MSAEQLCKRLRASIRMDAINGDSHERAVCAKQMKEAADEIERLRTENARLREDAARYRWLRDREIPEWLDLWHQNPDRIDAAIDAAQAQPKRRPYNASASLSEYGIFPECDAAPAAQAPRACTCHPDDRPDGPCRERYAASECQALAAQAQAANADALDAARYRWLRKGESDDVAVVRGLGAMDYGMSAVVCTYSDEIDGDDLDAAIDAAMEKEARNG